MVFSMTSPGVLHFCIIHGLLELLRGSSLKLLSKMTRRDVIWTHTGRLKVSRLAAESE